MRNIIPINEIVDVRNYISISIFNFRKVEFSVFKYGHVLCLLSINIIFPFLRIYICIHSCSIYMYVHVVAFYVIL